MQRPAAGSIVAIVVAVGVYLGYIGLCVGMEPLARSRYRVPSLADVAAGVPQATRDLALARMHDWEPYVGYLIIVGAAVLGGTAGAATLAARRGASITGIVLAAAVAFSLFAVPYLMTRQRAESKRTFFPAVTSPR